MRQLFVGAADELDGDLLAFERKLYVIRRVAERVGRPGPRDPELLREDAGLQGDAHRATARPVLPRPRRRADGERARARALALLDEHLPELGARPSVSDDRAQRRDQHAARERQLDPCARVAARVGALRQRHREARARHPPRRLGHRRLRQRARAARAVRPVAAARADDDGARGLRRPCRRLRRAARLLPLPRVPDRGVGRSRRRSRSPTAP